MSHDATAAGAKRRVLPWIALAIVWVVWGSTYLAIRVVVAEMPPFFAASFRFLCAGTLMAGVALVVDRRSGWPSARQWLDYSAIGVLLLAVGNGLVMWSERTVPSGTAALIVATVPVWLLLLDGLRPGGQPWTTRVWIGTAIGLLGVALVARPDAGASPPAGAGTASAPPSGESSAAGPGAGANAGRASAVAASGDTSAGSRTRGADTGARSTAGDGSHASAGTTAPAAAPVTGDSSVATPQLAPTVPSAGSRFLSGHWPAIIGLQVACLAWVTGSLWAQSVPHRLPLATAAAIEMLAGSVALALFASFFAEDPSRLAAASPRAWTAVVYLIVFGSLVGFTAFAYCLNELPATTVGTYAYVNPVVAVFLGWLILDETLTPGLLLGGLLIVLSVVLTTLKKKPAA